MRSRYGWTVAMFEVLRDYTGGTVYLKCDSEDRTLFPTGQVLAPDLTCLREASPECDVNPVEAIRDLFVKETTISHISGFESRSY